VAELHGDSWLIRFLNSIVPACRPGNAPAGIDTNVPELARRPFFAGTVNPQGETAVPGKFMPV
jgi:hypothetical protein